MVMKEVAKRVTGGGGGGLKVNSGAVVVTREVSLASGEEGAEAGLVVVAPGYRGR